MRGLSTFKEIYFYQAAIDMRKQINGLSILVESQMQLSPFTDALFLFLNQGGTIIKLLYWDKTGFAIWSKRLEKNRFARPPIRSGILTMTSHQLEDLLQGFDIFKRGHPELKYKKIC